MTMVSLADIIHNLVIWTFVSLVGSYHLQTVLNFVTFLDLHWISWFIIFNSIFSAFIIIRPQLKVSTKGKAVLITGCDFGFGYHLSLRLYDLGFIVFSTCKEEDSDGAKRLSQINPARLHVLPLDVTSQQQVDKTVSQVKQRLKDAELWGLVNNAGLATFGYTEWISVENYKRLAEVNLFGTIRVTKAFCPLIRQSKGRIVNMSSRMGLLSSPSRGPYSITKYAIESFTDTLRFELRPFKVDVILMEPGNYVGGTNILTKNDILQKIDEMWNIDMSEEVKSSYKDIFEKTTKRITSYSDASTRDISGVISSQVAALTEAYPRPRYQPMTLYYKLESIVALHCPEAIYEYLFIK